MKAYCASILWFAPPAEGPARALFEEDGLLVVGPNAAGTQVVQAVGSWAALSPCYPGVAVQHWPGRILAPGFVDLHVHLPAGGRDRFHPPTVCCRGWSVIPS